MPPRQRNIVILVGIMGTILLTLCCTRAGMRPGPPHGVDIFITNRTISVGQDQERVHISKNKKEQVQWVQSDGSHFTITFDAGKSPFPWEERDSKGQGKMQVLESGPAVGPMGEYKYSISSPDADQPLDPFVVVTK